MVRLRPYILLFAALIVTYHANLRPVDSSDTLPGSLIPLAVVLDHSVTLDRFVPWLKQHVPYTRAVIVTRNGHFYSQYPIGGPVFASPLYLPLTLFGLRDWDPGSLVMFARVAEKFAATLITALSAPFLLLLLKRITSAAWAWCFTLVYALGTATWSISSQALWQHGPAELALVGTLLCLAYWCEHRESTSALWICGACAAGAFIFRPTNVVLLPAILAGLLWAKASLKEHLRFWTLPLLGGLLIASYNLYVFHQVSGGYGLGGLRAPLWAGLAVILVSPGRGLLIFTPVAIFAVCAFLPGARAARRKYDVLVVTCSVFVILDLIVIAKWRIWWGGYCWGPRLLTELVPPLVVLMAIGVSAIDRSWPRRAFAVLALYSVLIQAVGVFFYPKGRWDGGPPNINSAPARVWNWRDNPIVRTIRGGPEWEPYAVIGTAITSGIPAAQRRMRELNANPYDEAPPEGVAPATRELR